MAKQEPSKRNIGGSTPGRGKKSTPASWLGRRLAARRAGEPEFEPSRSLFWWRLLALIAVLWWLAATAGDAVLEGWWQGDAQGAPEAVLPGGLPAVLPGSQPRAASTWGLDYVAAHLRLESFRWGGALAGALACGGWAWRQGRLAVANARESPASLGALWSVDDAGQPALGALGIEPHQTGRWIPLEDKLALDRFRPAALRICVAIAALIGAGLGSRAWMLWLSFWAARSLGRREPWLGADLSFYLFRLPALDFAWRLLLLAHVMALALALAIYLYEDSLQVGRRLWASARALRHIAVLLALALAWQAVGTLLLPFELLVRRSPSWSGPHAIDWFWRVPLAFAGALATLVCALLCLREAGRQRPRAVLGWSLAPLALSWIALGMVPALRQATLSNADVAREDAPFERAQTSWTLLALGFSALPPALDASSPPAPSTSAVASGPQSAPAARRALAAALSERDLASWASNAPDAEASGLSAATAARGAKGASTWGAPPAVLWQQATPSRFEPRTWDERHIDLASDVAWKRFAVQAPSPDDRTSASAEPARQDDATAASAAGAVGTAGAARLQPEDERRVPLLVGIDHAESPGLLLDTEVAEALATGAEMRRSAESVEAEARAGRAASLPVSSFNNSFNSTAQLAVLGELHSLPLFRVLMTGPQGRGAAHAEPQAPVGAALDASWKRWLAAWRFGSLGLARSARVRGDARLAWRLDASQRCRSLAPFLSWPDAPCPLLDERGRLFWLLDGYTLSAAFPLARPLDAAGAFAVPEPDLSPSPGSTSSSPAASSMDAAHRREEQEEQLAQRRRFVTSIMRREEVLARVALDLDGFNWARASVAALVDASTGAVRLFPLHQDDPILSLYRRALPGLWSRPESLPPFARAALRTPPHLAALQSAAWANAIAPSARPVNQARTPSARSHTWQVSGCFFVPTEHGLRTGVLHRLAAPLAQGQAGLQPPAAAASTWAVALSPAPWAAGQDEDAHWQSHIFDASTQTSSATHWSLADAALPLEPGPAPTRWLARQRSSVVEDASANTSGRQPQQRGAADAAAPGHSTGPGAQDWQRARDLWRRAMQARSNGEHAREQEMSRQLEQMLEHNARSTP